MLAGPSRSATRSLRSLKYVRLSSSLADLQVSLRSNLTSRRLPILHDYLSPQSSYLLTKSLQDFLPKSPDVLAPSKALPSIRYPRPLPPGHHIAYFPTPTTASELLPDGTDTIQSPGPPFNRRMWAGGRIRFPPEGGPLLDGGRAVCVEGVRDVRVTGKEGDEKVFVEIERRVARIEEHEEEHEIRQRVWTAKPEDQGDSALIERRDLVFLRDKPKESSTDRSETSTSLSSHTTSPPRKSLTPPTDPTYTQTLIPTPSLLFRYSALMFNAHSIHLDPLYTRSHESHPEILVHGPLLLTFLLTCLNNNIISSSISHQPPHSTTSDPLPSNLQTIREISYRNLAPVYCGQPMKVCGKLRPRRPLAEPSDPSEEWDVWIEGPDGGMRVRGTVITAPFDWEGGGGDNGGVGPGLSHGGMAADLGVQVLWAGVEAGLKGLGHGMQH